MKITKLGHCCLLIETKGKRIATDPGSFTIEAHSKLENIDAVLFTHEHADHFHVESLKTLLVGNPNAKVYANTSVSELLAVENIVHEKVLNNGTFQIGEIVINGIGEKHCQMHSSVPASSNTGFFIDNRLWYPGDAFTNPERPVEILALPVSGPWMKIADAIDYAILLKPRVAFPVHDGIRFGSSHRFPEKILPPLGIEFIPMIEGESKEF